MQSRVSLCSVRWLFEAPQCSEWIRRGIRAKNSLSLSENRRGGGLPLPLVIRKMKFLPSFIWLENSTNEGMKTTQEITPLAGMDDL